MFTVSEETKGNSAAAGIISGISLRVSVMMRCWGRIAGVAPKVEAGLQGTRKERVHNDCIQVNNAARQKN